LVALLEDCEFGEETSTERNAHLHELEDGCMVLHSQLGQTLSSKPNETQGIAQEKES